MASAINPSLMYLIFFLPVYGRDTDAYVYRNINGNGHINNSWLLAIDILLE
jgi:hypothetical protein